MTNKITISKLEHKGEFKPISFATKAVAKDSSRPALQYLSVKDGKVIGCDGLRMHIAKTDLLGDGLYFVEKSIKDLVVLSPPVYDLTYPDVDRVAPVDTVTVCSQIEKGSAWVSRAIANYVLWCREYKDNGLNLTSTLNHEVVMESVEFMGKDIVLKAGKSEEEPAIIITDGIFTSVIMPIVYDAVR